MVTGLAALWVTFSLLSKGGAAHQAWLNFTRKSCAGVSVPMFTIGALGYLAGAAYGINIGSWSLVVSQAPGVVLWFAVLGQAVWYGRAR